MISDTNINSIYDCYRRAMASVGRSTQLPSNTEPSKTYAYRAVRKFVEQIREWNLSGDLTLALVREIIKYGKRHGLLNKGTALLNMRSILKICYNYLSNEIIRINELINSIKRSKNFIDKINGNTIEKMIGKERPGSYTNLVRWFKSGSITLSFIIVSRTCNKVLTMLPDDERSLFPYDTILLASRLKIMRDADTRTNIIEILGNDAIIDKVLINENR